MLSKVNQQPCDLYMHLALYDSNWIVDAPDVTVVFGFDRIYCSPDGIPDTYTFNRWEHQSEQGEHIRFLDGLENGTLILQTLPQQYQISGRYVCTVSNGIPDINGINLQKGFISHNYEGKTATWFYIRVICLPHDTLTSKRAINAAPLFLRVNMPCQVAILVEI